MRIISVVGARPNFMKIAPFTRVVNRYISEGQAIEHILVHTGQHYDDRMSGSFFEQLGIPAADINLGIGSGTHAEQVGRTMIAFEKVLKEKRPEWVVIVGDVNAILACSVTAKKENIRCCHIEAGLRSGDMSMPEEINRLVADRICDLLLTPDRISSENLRKEGIPESKIRFVGNIMIDTLDSSLNKALKLDISSICRENAIGEHVEMIKAGEDYAVMTLHRPSNVDSEDVLKNLVDFALTTICRDRKLIWSLHPRTMKMAEEFNLMDRLNSQRNLVLLKPIGYLEMLRLNSSAAIMLTDSGGLQEECTVLGTPCLTMRWNTERPVTLTENGGVSRLVGNNIDRIKAEYSKALAQGRKPVRPELWDGKTAERCLSAILEYKPQA